MYDNENELMIDAIKICQLAVENSKLQPYRATKTASVFGEIQKDINMDS